MALDWANLNEIKYSKNHRPMCLLIVFYYSEQTYFHLQYTRRSQR